MTLTVLNPGEQAVHIQCTNHVIVLLNVLYLSDIIGSAILPRLCMVLSFVVLKTCLSLYCRATDIGLALAWKPVVNQP